MSKQDHKSQQNRRKRWNVYNALRKSRTETEANPPAESAYDQSSVPLSVTVSDVIAGIIHNVQSEYGLSNKSQSAQRLLRVGLQEIANGKEGEFDQEELLSLGAYRDVVFKYVPSVGEAKFGFGALREEQELPVNYGWDTKNKSESFAVFWNQKEQIRRFKEQLRASDADIFQWGIIEAAIVMGEEGLVDEDEAKRARETREAIWESVADRIRFTRTAALMTITRAYDAESHDRVADYCKRTVPDLWQEFKKITSTNHESLKENEFLYGVDI